MLHHSFLYLLAPLLAVILLAVALRVEQFHRSRSLREMAALGRQLRSARGPENIKPWDIAVSYVARDAGNIDPIIDLLRSSGLRIFDYRDEDVLPTTVGKRLQPMLDEIYGGKAEVCVVFLSQAYFRSSITAEELETAYSHDSAGIERYILPVLVRKCSLPSRLKAIVHLDARKGRPEAMALSILKVLIDRIDSRRSG